MKVIKFTYRLWPNWIRSISNRINDHRIKAKCTYSMEQIVFSGLMLFLLRYRSLRSFYLENRGNKSTLKNFNRWVTINEIPSDDDLRYSLQTTSTLSLNNLLRDYHQVLERKKILSDQKFFGAELVALDGTGQLSSQNIACEKCLTKTLSNGDVVYYHGQLLASLTNAKATCSLPLQFEPIEKDDTSTEFSKNDCEYNAAKRLLAKMKTQFPKRNFCFLGDNLFGVDPMVRLIKEKGWHFIITAKPERNTELFFMYNYLHEQRQLLETRSTNNHTHQHHHYRWSNRLPLRQ